MGKQVSLDDFGPELEEEFEELESKTSSFDKDLSRSFMNKLLEGITRDDIMLFLSYTATGDEGRALSDVFYIKPSQVRDVARQLMNAKENEWIVLEDEIGVVTGMFKNSSDLAIVKFLDFKSKK